MLERKSSVLRGILLGGSFAFAAVSASGTALAQAVPHSTVASPDVYKVLKENEEYRVISVTWKPGQRDAWHSHPSSGVYSLMPCSLRIHMPDGNSRDVNPPAGAAFVQKPIASHSLENIGKTDCKLIMFEPR